jgi:Uma2 family endonuclease
MAAGGLAKRPASYEDLLRVPPHLVAELLNGELYTTPRPALRHARVATVLGSEIVGPFDRGRGGPGGWLFLTEPELHLQADVVVPDLAGWRRTRLSDIPDAAFLTLAPDWVCEVVSPSTERIDRTSKLSIYAREGVSHAWLINPASETLEILGLAGGRWTLLDTFAGAVVVHAEPFEVFDLDLSALWTAGAPSDTDAAPPSPS